jgi:hypothetical protein
MYEKLKENGCGGKWGETMRIYLGEVFCQESEQKGKRWERVSSSLMVNFPSFILHARPQI